MSINAKVLKIWVILLTSLALILPGVSNAVTLYEQAPLTDGSAESYPSTQLVWGQQLFENFELIGSANIESIGWWGSYLDNATYTDDFVIELYSTLDLNKNLLSGVTGIFSKSPDVYADLYGANVYNYLLDISATPLSLQAGSYYLSVHNEYSEWYWLASALGDSKVRSDRFAAPDLQDNLSFQVNGTQPTSVPEPSALLLLAIGLVSAAGVYNIKRLKI